MSGTDSERRNVERFEDMSPDGRLHLIRQPDGDIVITVIQSDERGEGSMSTVEFCTPFSGGGQSEHTWKALLKLYEAMQKDEKERPQDHRRRNLEKAGKP